MSHPEPGPGMPAHTEKVGVSAVSALRPSPDASLLRRVRWQLVAWSGGATLVVLLLLGAILYGVAAHSLEQSTVAQLQSRGTAIADVVQGGRPFERRALGLAFGGVGSGTLAFVIDPTGAWVPSDLAIPGLPDQAGVAAARLGGTDIRTTNIQDIPVRIYSRAATRNGQQYIIQVVADRTTEARTLADLLVVLAIGGLGAVVIAGAAGFLYAGRALVPIRESLRRQREFAADASHELRTPLSVIRASVDHLQRHRRRSVASVGTALDDIDAEVGRLTSLVDDLLLLARADSGAVELEGQPIDLADVAADALPQLSQVASERGVSLVLDPLPAPTVGDPGRLRQVVGILVDNAIRHSPPSGQVVVRTRRDRDGATLVVEDEGPGVPPDDRVHIFERFWRAPGAPPGGVGLGLAIARWIIQRHGGSISVEAVVPHGARFTVRLPA
jgi:signal transduction histidine kinase